MNSLRTESKPGDPGPRDTWPTMVDLDSLLLRVTVSSLNDTVTTFEKMVPWIEISVGGERRIEHAVRMLYQGVGVALPAFNGQRIRVELDHCWVLRECS